MSDVGLRADLEVNADGVQKGTQQAISSLDALQNRIKEVEAELAKASDDPSFNKLATQYNNLSKNIQILSKGEIKIPPVDLKPINDTNEAIKKVGTSTDGLGNIMNRSLHGVADLFIAPGRAAMIFANDLPQLVTRFQELRAEQQALAAAGQESKSSMALLGEAFNPLGLGIGIASIALIHFFESTINSKKEITSLAEANDMLNKSLSNNSGYSEAISNVAKLTDDVKLAEKGVLSKNAVLKEYNETIGKTTGQVKVWSQLEDKMVNDLPDYLKMMAAKAVAAEAYAQYAKKAVEAAVQENTPLASNNISFAESLWSVLTGGLTDPENYKRNLEDAKTQAVRAKKDAAQILQDLAKGQESSVSDYFKKHPAWDFLNGLGDNSTQKVNALTKAQNDLNASLAETAAQLKAGNITPAEADTQRLAAYKKNLAALFQNHASQGAIDNDLKQINSLKSTLADFKIEEYKKQFDELQESLSFKVANGLETPLEAAKESLRAAQTELEKLTTGENKLSLDDSRVIDAQKQIADLTAGVKALSIQAIFSDAENKSTVVQNELNAGFITPLEAVKKQIFITKQSLGDLLDNGVSANNQKIIDLQIKLNGENIEEGVLQVQSDLQKIIGNYNDKKSDIEFEASVTPDFDISKANLSNDREALDKLNKELREAIQKGLDTTPIEAEISNIKFTYNADATKLSLADIGKQIVSVTEKGIEDLSEGLGTALASGKWDFSTLGAPFLEDLGAAIENFGKEVIEKSSAMVALQKALESAFGLGQYELGIGIGVAIVALGAALKALAKKGTSSKASNSSIAGTSLGSYSSSSGSYGNLYASSGSSSGAAMTAGSSVSGAPSLGQTVAQNIQSIPLSITIDGQIKNDVILLAAQRAAKKNSR